MERLELNFVSGSRYLGAYIGPKKELEAWIKPQVEAWAHRVIFLGKIYRQHPQLDHAGSGMSLKLECQYLQRTVPGVGTLMGTIEEALREKKFSALFRGDEINLEFWKILGHSVKHGGLDILDP